MDEQERTNLIHLLNQSVVTYRAASWWGQADYRCVEILMEIEVFNQLEKLLNTELNGRIGKQYEGRPQNADTTRRSTIRESNT